MTSKLQKKPTLKASINHTDFAANLCRKVDILPWYKRELALKFY